MTKLVIEVIEVGDRVVHRTNSLSATVGRVEVVDQGENLIGVRYPWGLQWFAPNELRFPWWSGD